MTLARPTLSVIIPCHNEEAILKATADHLVRFLCTADWDCGLGKTWEIVFVDDGSSDTTLACLQEIQGTHPNIVVATYPRAGGQGKALQHGFSRAKGLFLVTIDADLDYKPSYIPRMMQLAIDAHADLVIASPYMKGGTITNCPRSRLLMSRAMNLYFRHVFHSRLSTFTAIFRLYRREALEKLLLSSFDKDILPEIIVKAELLRLSIVEFPVDLSWSDETIAVRGRGLNILPTAKKAGAHILIGVVENPFYFLRYPLIGFLLAALWISTSVIILVTGHFSSGKDGFFKDLTNALAASFYDSPHTFLFFVGIIQIAFLFLFATLIIIQNKSKREDDFKILTRLHETIMTASPFANKPDSASREAN